MGDGLLRGDHEFVRMVDAGGVRGVFLFVDL